MLFLLKHVNCSFFQLFTLVLNSVFLVSFRSDNYALAQYLGPDPRYPAPFGGLFGDTSDYPNDNDLRQNFLGTGTHQTLMMAMSKSRLPLYKEYCRTPELLLRCVFDAFPPGYLDRRDRNGKELSERWARDFFWRYQAVYMAGASGTAYILVDRSRLPRMCPWFYHIVEQLQRNPNVICIICVPALDWNLQWIYWTRRDKDDGATENDGNRDGGPSAGNGEIGNNLLGTAASLILPAVAGPIGATLDVAGAANALIPNLPSNLPLVSGDRQDKNLGVNPLEFPLKTDVLHSPTASRPFFGDNTVGSSGDLALASTDGTSALEPQTDATSSTSKTIGAEIPSRGTSAIDKTTDPGSEAGSTFKTNEQIADSEIPDLRNLVLRGRRRALLPRDDDDCLDWMVNLDYSGDPSQPAEAVGGTSSDLKTAPSDQTGFNFQKLNLLAKEEVTTISITQHDKLSDDGSFHLDIKILDSQGNKIQDLRDVVALPGKEVKVPVPWKIDLPPNSLVQDAPFSWPVYLSPGNNREGPIKIRYEDPLMVGPETDWGWTFDSNDPRHHCVVGAWIDSKREIQCDLVVAHPSLPRLPGS